MKIGILTFANAYNYGAILQCYALYRTLEQYGLDVYIINYRPNYLNHTFPRPPIKKFLKFKISEGLLIYRDSIRFYKLFRNFTIANYRYTNACTSYSSLEKEVNNFDYVILGSDQVWTRKHNKFDKAWYGGYGKTKWIGYAVSAGDCLFQNDELIRISESVKKFQSISVREDILSNIVSSLTQKEIPVVLDPTLLADRGIWNAWTNPVVEGKYILVYQARQTDLVFSVAEKLANKIGNCKIIPICGWGNVYRSDYKRYIASPSDFISLVKNAEYVVTTSFHGTVFSIILGTNFYTIKLNDGSDYRCVGLLNSFGLENRLIDSDALINLDKIDYQPVYEKLAEYKTVSLDYIKKSLNIYYV